MDIILSFALLLFPDVQMDTARSLALSGKHEKSNAVLSLVNPRYVNRSTYHYYRLLNAFCQNRRQAAQQELDALSGCFDHLPQRHVDLIFLMREDLKNWKQDDIADISRDMKNIAERLAHAKGGPQTRSIQDDVVRKLDKLIEQAEKETSDQEELEKQRQQQQQDQRQSQQHPDSPQDDSRIGLESGLGQADVKRFRETAKNWGKLPDKERAQAILGLTKDLPPRQRDLIERYFKQLSQAK